MIGFLSSRNSVLAFVGTVITTYREWKLPLTGGKLVALVALFVGLVVGLVDCLAKDSAADEMFLVIAFFCALGASMFFYFEYQNFRVLLWVLIASGWLLAYFDYWIGAYFSLVCWLVYILLYR